MGKTANNPQGTHHKKDDVTVENTATTGLKRAGRVITKTLKVVTGIQGFQDRKVAHAIKNEADTIKNGVDKEANEILANVNTALLDLCKYREDALKNTVCVFYDYIQRIGNKVKDKEYSIPSSIDVKKEEVKPLNIKLDPKAVGPAIAAAAGVSYTVNVGTKAAIKRFGKRGKVGGKPIKKLHGAAQENAMWAKIGGGPKSKGGGGVKLGKVRYAKISKIATIVITIVTIGSEISAAFAAMKKEAEENLKNVKIWAEKTKAGYAVISGLKSRIDEIHMVTEELELRTIQELWKLEPYVDCYNPDDIIQLQIFSNCLELNQSMSTLAMIPVLSKDGKISDEITVEVKASRMVLNHLS